MPTRSISLAAVMRDDPELRDYLRVLWGGRRLLFGLVLLSLVIALLVSLVAPRVYEAEGLLEIGRVWEKALESAYVSTEVLNSDPMLLAVAREIGLEPGLTRLRRMPLLAAEVIESGPERQAMLVRVRGRGKTPEESVAAVESACRLVIERHEKRFQSMLDPYRKYEGELGKQISEVQAEIEALDQLLKKSRTAPAVQAPAVILMQSQLEEKQTQLIEFQKELRDVRLKNNSSVYTENTNLAAHPVPPQNPVSPRLSLNLLLAGIGSLALATGAIFALDYFRSERV